MITTKQVVDHLIDEQFPIFGDIVKSMGGLPEIPEELLPFDARIKNKQMQEIGYECFLAWLHLKLVGRTPRIPADMILPCSDDPDIYFQDWPVTEDFPAGEDSPAFQAQVRRVEIQTAIAKEGCSTCPVRLTCLLKAVQNDDSFDKYRQLVMGGWGDGARASIRAQVAKLQRSYEKGVREDEYGITRDSKNSGISKEERENHERLAMTISVSS